MSRDLFKGLFTILTEDLPSVFRAKWKHPDPSVRNNGVQKLSDRTILAGIAKDDESEDVRQAAFERLRELSGTRGAVEDLKSVCSPDELEGILVAVHRSGSDFDDKLNSMLAEIATPKAIDCLIYTFLQGHCRDATESSNVLEARKCAKEALLKLGEEARPGLLDALEDQSRLQSKIRDVLAELEHHTPPTTPTQAPAEVPASEVPVASPRQGEGARRPLAAIAFVGAAIVLVGTITVLSIGEPAPELHTPGHVAENDAGELPKGPASDDAKPASRKKPQSESAKGKLGRTALHRASFSSRMASRGRSWSGR